VVTTKRKAPVKGVCRWVGEAVNGNRLLTITPEGGVEQCYEVEELAKGAGYNLHRVDLQTGEFYCHRVTRDAGGTLHCNCPDVTKGGRKPWECKHARSLFAALRKAF
jgi:hypothetical protein